MKNLSDASFSRIKNAANKKTLSGIEKRDAYFREVLSVMEDMLGGDDSLIPWSDVPPDILDGWVRFETFSDYDPILPAEEAAKDLVYNESFDPRDLVENYANEGKGVWK